MMTPASLPAARSAASTSSPAHVGQVYVEQHQVGRELGHQRERVGAGAGDADHLEPLGARDEALVDPRDHEVVVDDEDADHGAPAAPVRSSERADHREDRHRPRGARVDVAAAPASQISCTSGSPIPRPPSTSVLVENPRTKIASAARRARPGPLSRRPRRWTARPARRPRRSTAAPGRRRRRPARCRRGCRARWSGRRRPPGRAPAVGVRRSARSATPRSAARLVLAISRAATAGSSMREVTTSLISARRRRERADEPRDLVVLPELHEPGDRVQLVAELVGLRAQGVGDRRGWS